jgi:hypothetical protein
MDDYLNEEFVDKYSIKSYEHSEMILSLFFAIIDLIIIIISSLNLKSKSYIITILKSKVIKLFLFDIIIRILYIRKYDQLSFYKELLLTMLDTSQFYIIISFLDEVLYNSSISVLKKSKDKGRRIKLCSIFAIITFSYEKLSYPYEIKYLIFIKINKFIIIIQSFVLLFYIYKSYQNFKKKLCEIGNNLIKETHSTNKNYLIILGSPYICALLFSFYYVLKICFVFIKRPVFFIYANIVLNIIKDTSKYFTFFICELIIYMLDKIKTEKEKNNKFKSYIDEKDLIQI